MWHSDGDRESIVAVVLYYYRSSQEMLGGDLEFLAHEAHPRTFVSYGDGYGAQMKSKRIAGKSFCRAKVKEGTMVVFSNYSLIHRVLKMRATKEYDVTIGSETLPGVASRDFVALFVVDQKKKLSTRRSVRSNKKGENLKIRYELFKEQLSSHRVFSLSDGSDVVCAGNGSPALLKMMSSKNTSSESLLRAAANDASDFWCGDGVWGYDEIVGRLPDVSKRLLARKLGLVKYRSLSEVEEDDFWAILYVVFERFTISSLSRRSRTTLKHLNVTNTYALEHRYSPRGDVLNDDEKSMLENYICDRDRDKSSTKLWQHISIIRDVHLSERLRVRRYVKSQRKDWVHEFLDIRRKCMGDDEEEEKDEDEDEKNAINKLWVFVEKFFPYEFAGRETHVTIKVQRQHEDFMMKRRSKQHHTGADALNLVCEPPPLNRGLSRLFSDS